jgi:hypothetical protein
MSRIQVAPGFETRTIIRRNVIRIEPCNPLARLVLSAIGVHGPRLTGCMTPREALNQIAFGRCFARLHGHHECPHEPDFSLVMHIPSKDSSVI